MSRRRCAICLVWLSCAAIVPMTPLSGFESSRLESRLSKASRSIVVTTAAELVAALSADPGDLTVFVQPGTYELDHAIRVPDNMTLIGAGTMLYNDSGLPTGFVPESRPVIAAMPTVTGDFVTLSDGASLQGLVIQDVIRPGITGGAVVVVSSGAPRDSVSALVVECEIINPNPAGSAAAGPTGRGLVAITRNPHFTDGAVPHEQSSVSVHLTHSIIRSPGGGSSVFGINFASGSHVELHLRQNVLGGQFNVTGGASRPDSVVGSTLLVQSSGNLYLEDGAVAGPGWNLQGGTDTRINGTTAGETLNNRLSVHSVDDRLEGFDRAIIVNGGRRNFALSAGSSSNEVQLILQGTRLVSTIADLRFFGAQSAVAGMAAGDGNELRVTMDHVIGSGPRTNAYVDAQPDLGIGNRLRITGSLMAFSHTNQAILPMPEEVFFSGGR